MAERLTIYGRIKQRSAKELLFQLAINQRRDVPIQAWGRSFWFPRSSSTPFTSVDNRGGLMVPRHLLYAELAKLTNQPEESTHPALNATDAA